MINRIYEIREGFNIDLERIVVVDCSGVEELKDLYNLIINAWQTYANGEMFIPN